MLVALTGLLAGFAHVLSGPDHLAAVSPLAVDNKRKAWIIGLKWGLGHTSGVFLVGFLLLFFREFIPLSILSSYSNRLVGIVLIVIGIWGLQQLFNTKLHQHDHNGIMHFHLQTHKHSFHTQTALTVGIIHGLAGSSHVLGVLPALAFPTEYEAAIYLLCFGFGTIAAMVIFSQVLGILALSLAEKSVSLYRRFSVSLSSIAISLGIFWLIL